MEQYSLKKNLQNKNCLEYLQNKRNTYNYQDNNFEFTNIIKPDTQRINNSEINDYDTNHKNYSKKVENKNIASNEKYLSLNKFNSSISTNDLFIGNEHDILIEYGNVPIIHTKRINNDNYLNTCSKENISYLFKNSNYKNIKDLSYDNNNSILSLKKDNIIKINYDINYESYASNNVNKNLYKNDYFDINISNNNNNNKIFSNEKNYNYLISNKRQLLEQTKTFDNLTNKKININSLNNKNINILKPPFKKYKTNKEYIIEFKNNSNINFNNNNNTNKKINSSTIKKRDFEIKKTQNKSKGVINNKLMNIHSQKVSNKNITNSKLNIIRKNFNNQINNNNSKEMPKLNKSNKSKKDIFYNKEFKNKINNQKKSMINSSKPQRHLNNNIQILNQNKNQLKVNYNKNYIDDNDKNSDSSKEIFELEYFNNSNKRKKYSNKRNTNSRQKFLLFKKDKTNNIIDEFNSMETNNKFSILYNLNNELYKSTNDKISNLTECYNSQDNINILESKLNTSRCSNSKIKNENLIFSSGYLKNDFININNYVYKSYNINSKKEKKTLNNLISDRKIENNTTNPNYFNDYDSNIVNNIDNNYKIININFNDHNSQYVYDEKKNNISQLLTNQKEENKNKEIYNSNYNNINSNKFIKNQSKYILNENSKGKSCYKLNIKNYNIQLSQNPIKLSSKKIDIKDFIKEKNNRSIIHNNNNIIPNINDNKQIIISNKIPNNNKIIKFNTVDDNNKIINNKNNNIININNNTSNVNVLNLKNSSINICIDKKDKFNILSPEKNINYINPTINKEIKIDKNNKLNVKNVANELFEKNKNLNNLKSIKPLINRSNTNHISLQNNLKITTNTIRYNKSFNVNKGENINNKNTKSFKNILIKSNDIENNYNPVNKKKLIENNSEIFLFNKKILNSDPSYSNINNNKKVYLNNLKLKENLKNNNYNNMENKKSNTIILEKKGLIKTIKFPESEKDNINYYKKINFPLYSTLNSIYLNTQNTNNDQSKKGVYIKPYCILAMSKPKTNFLKSKSELKININIKKNEIKNGKNLYFSNKTTKNLSSEIHYNTYPKSFRKKEGFKNNFGKKRKGSNCSLNVSFNSKNIYNYILNKNENDITSENNNNLKNKIIKNIREPLKKIYCFYSKFYNYYIKIPKIEIHFIKKYKKYNRYKNMVNRYIKDKNIFSDINQISLNTQEINNDEEKNNESSQNGLIMTFGEMNNRKNNEKSNALINSNSKNNNKIVNMNDNIMEDSDIEFYKSLQQGTFQNKNDKSSKLKLNNSESEDLKMYESSEKEKDLSENCESEIYKNTKGEQIYEDYENQKSKTYKKSLKNNLENAEKGLKILGKLAQRRGIRSNDELLSIENFHINNKDNYHKKNDNIFLGTNKLNELFNSRKETESSNSEKINEDIYNDKNKIKISKSVNKDIMQGISKIKNVLEKNINNLEIESNEKNKINNYEPKIKINKDDTTSKYNEYYNIMDFSEILNTKKRENIPKSNTNLGTSNSNNTFDSYLDALNNDNSKIPRYKESEILLNKNRNDIRNSNDNKDSILPIKFNLLNDEIFNQENDLLSYSEEDLKSNYFYNSKNNFKEFEIYIKSIKKFQTNNIKHDLIFLLNILVKNNYDNILNQITKIILYKDNNILNNSNEIIENEHLIKNIIFKEVEKGKKYIIIFAKLCNDLNNNLSNILNEQDNIKNNKERNLKIIINDECISLINSFKTIKLDNNQKEKDEYYFFRKKIINFSIFLFELIKIELLKQQFGIYALEQLYKIFIDNDHNNIIQDLFLEAIIILLNKFGKYIFEKNNIKLIRNINIYIENNLKNIINNNKISKYLVYRIINLITKVENKWKDDLSELIEKKENLAFSLLEEQKNNNFKIKNNNMSNRIWNKEINIDDVNKSIIEEDLFNYISYFSEENNKGLINVKINNDKSYNWKIIEELINDKNFGLESIINYFIIVCTNIINDDYKLFLCNDYIKNIIEYYANNLSKKAIDSIHNEMIKTFLNIDEIVNKNKIMSKVLGNLLFILIDNKLYHIKYFNHYLKVEKLTQINLAIITRYCILSSGKFAKKYLNDFKQTKLFNNNEIFEIYINEPLKDLLFFFK